MLKQQFRNIDPFYRKQCFNSKLFMTTSETQAGETEFSHKIYTIRWFRIFVQIKNYVNLFLCGKYHVKKFITDAQNLQISFRNQPVWKIVVMTVDGSDSLVPVERKKKIITPQPGNEPGTSWLSFRCSTNWATKESMLSHLHKTVTVQWPYICYAPFAPTGWWLMTFGLRGCLHV